jgi:hypothetical protein
MASEATCPRSFPRPATALSRPAMACLSAGEASPMVAAAAFAKAVWVTAVFASWARSAARFDGTGAAR